MYVRLAMNVLIVFTVKENVIGELILYATNSYSYLKHHINRAYIQKLVQIC